MAVEQRAVAVRQHDDPTATKAVWVSAGSTNLTPDQARALGMVGQRYDLDPALGEVMILGNKVYITMEGYLRIAEQHPEYDGYELWPLTEQERGQMRIAETEDAWGCRVWRKGRQHPAVGYGHASAANISMGTMKPFSSEVAQKRAFHRALRTAFRARVPGPDEALSQADDRGVVSVIGEVVDDKPPKPPAPDWSGFWLAVKQLGVTDEQVHQVLGVASVTDWDGTLESAYEKVRLWKRQHGDKPAKQYEIAPLRERYAKLAEKAEALGIVVEPLTEDMAGVEILRLGRELQSVISFREAGIPPSNPGDGEPV